MESKQLIVFRRHGRDCEKNLNALGVPKDARRYYDCQSCTFWVAGHLPDGTPVVRRSLGTSDRKVAEANILALGRMVTIAIPEPASGPMLAECVTKYVLRRSDLKPKTSRDTEKVLTGFAKFCAEHGVTAAKDVTFDLCDGWKASLKLADSSKRNYVARVLGFLEYAWKAKWLGEPLHTLVDGHKAAPVQVDPFSPDEQARLLAAAAKLQPGRKSGDTFRAHPQTFYLMLKVAIEIGLRIGDLIEFEPARLVERYGVFEYTFVPEKQKLTVKQRTVSVYLSRELKAELDRCHWLSADKPFRGARTSHGAAYQQAYQMLKVAAKLAGVEGAHPHRLRHSRALNLRLSGEQRESVRLALGHARGSTTESFYFSDVDSVREAHGQRMAALLRGEKIDR